jgi:exonuclease III
MPSFLRRRSRRAGYGAIWHGQKSWNGVAIHFLLSPDVAARLVKAEVAKDVRGWEHTSDHAPTWIELAEKAVKSSKRNG